MKLRCVFNDIMRKQHRQGVMLGQTTASTAEEYFGFRSGEVKEIHFHKRDVGAGLWFRLQCGRVIDEAAKPSCRAPHLYDYAGACA